MTLETFLSAKNWRIFIRVTSTLLILMSLVALGLAGYQSSQWSRVQDAYEAQLRRSSWHYSIISDYLAAIGLVLQANIYTAIIAGETLIIHSLLAFSAWSAPQANDTSAATAALAAEKKSKWKTLPQTAPLTVILLLNWLLWVIAAGRLTDTGTFEFCSVVYDNFCGTRVALGVFCWLIWLVHTAALPLAATYAFRTPRPQGGFRGKHYGFQSNEARAESGGENHQTEKDVETPAASVQPPPHSAAVPVPQTAQQS